MNSGIIGSGNISSNLSKLWSQSGHAVFFNSRSPEQLEPLVCEVGHGARAGTTTEAVQFDGVILFTLSF